jgi:hypothetical protein
LFRTSVTGLPCVRLPVRSIKTANGVSPKNLRPRNFEGPADTTAPIASVWNRNGFLSCWPGRPCLEECPTACDRRIQRQGLTRQSEVQGRSLATTIQPRLPKPAQARNPAKTIPAQCAITATFIPFVIFESSTNPAAGRSAVRAAGVPHCDDGSSAEKLSVSVHSRSHCCAVQLAHGGTGRTRSGGGRSGREVARRSGHSLASCGVATVMPTLKSQLTVSNFSYPVRLTPLNQASKGASQDAGNLRTLSWARAVFDGAQTCCR